MKTIEDVLEFIDEQIWYTQMQAKDEGINLPLLFEVEKPTANNLAQKQKIYHTIKWFIQQEL